MAYLQIIKRSLVFTFLLGFFGCQVPEPAPGSELEQSFDVEITVVSAFHLNPRTGKKDFKKVNDRFVKTRAQAIWFGTYSSLKNTIEAPKMFIQTAAKFVPQEWGFSSAVYENYYDYTLILPIAEEESSNEFEIALAEAAHLGMIEKVEIFLFEENSKIELRSVTLNSRMKIRKIVGEVELLIRAVNEVREHEELGTVTSSAAN